MVVAMSNTLATSYAGPEAGMNALEQMLIVPSLEQVLATPAVMQAAGKYAAPVSLVTGMGIWGLRIVTLKRGQRASEPEPTLEQTPPATSYDPSVPTPPNGQTATDLSTEETVDLLQTMARG